MKQKNKPCTEMIIKLADRFEEHLIYKMLYRNWITESIADNAIQHQRRKRHASK